MRLGGRLSFWPHTENMTGKLNEHPLAELIREIVSEKLSGLLRLEYERIKKAIYFDGGELVYATSNLRQLRLAEWLKRWRVITDGQFSALSLEGKTDAETGRALLEQGVLTEEALNEVRARLIVDVLRPALLWTQGTWDFDPRVRLAAGEARVSVQLPELLMEAARRFPKNQAAARFPNTNEKVSPAQSPANDLNLLPAEAFIISRIDATLRLYEVLAVSGLPKEETLHACYALALGGFIERESWPRAFNPEEVAKALAAGAAAAKNAKAASHTVEAKKKEEPAKPVDPEVDERRELEELFERVKHATNHYQVLGVGRSVDQDAIKQTYHRLARRYHPDRFHQDPTLRGRVEELFAKFAQAYDTLRDRSARAAYDLKIEREKDMRPAQPPPGSEPKAQPVKEAASPPASQRSGPSTTTTSASERAEESFQMGLNVLKMGNAARALSFFAEAARLEPNRARYRAQYGRLLAASAQMRHRAETELQAAITLEPNNSAYRVILAKLYQDLGFNKRAQGELERTLALDPQNVEARQLLAQLQSTQGTR